MRVSRLIARFICDVKYAFSIIDRRAVTENLTCILPWEDKVNLPVREVFRGFGQYLLEFFLVERMLKENYIEKNVQIQNLKYIEEALARGKGGIILTAHIGNWELGGALLGVLGYPLTVIALPHKEESVNNFFNKKRAGKGLTVVPSNTAVRRCISALKKNTLIALVADRDFSNKGEVLKVFGRQTVVPKGPAAFSVKTGAPIIPVFLIRKDNAKFQLIIEKPIFPEKKPQNQESTYMIEIMEKYITIMEDKIRQYPGQWIMFRRFWVT